MICDSAPLRKSKIRANTRGWGDVEFGSRRPRQIKRRADLLILNWAHYIYPRLYLARKCAHRRRQPAAGTLPTGSKMNGRAGPWVLALVRALTTRATPFYPAAIAPSEIERALDIGLGPALAHVAADNASAARNLPFAERIRAAALTARAFTAGKYDTLAEVLTAAQGIECRVVLLKGAATALRYYPAPHLRPMGDIDVLVPIDRQPLLEARLRALGFQQRSNQPAAAFDGWHHSMPFHCSQRGTWIDVHSNVYPPHHPHARDSLFSWEAISSQLSPVGLGKQTAYAMNHELQLVFTSARWAEEFDPARGLYPILDAALLIGKHGDTLDWDRILALVRGSWAGTALHLMLSYLQRWDLTIVPPEVLSSLVASDRHANRIFFRLLHRLITMYAIEGRPFGLAATTEGHLRVVWSSLLRPMSPTANLFSVPFHLACPPGHPERFSPLYAMRRVGAFVRRAVLKGSAPPSGA
jgi:hypothetical protein